MAATPGLTNRTLCRPRRTAHSAGRTAACPAPRRASCLALLSVVLSAVGVTAGAQTQPTGTPVDTTQPVGSFTNPLLARGPAGQAEYIARMRCPGGSAPTVLGRGSRAGGPHGHIIDGYQLRCAGDSTTHLVHMDMYHGEGDRERRAATPFTVLAEHPARLAEGCPPRVVADADSSARYVFIWWEVEKPARLTNPPPERIVGPTRGFSSFNFIVDTTGLVDPSSVKPAAAQDTTLQRLGERMIPTLRFEPAEHRPGCHVRQFSGIRFTFAPE